MSHDRYKTVQELAERLEVAEATVRQWIKSGLLRAIDATAGVSPIRTVNFSSRRAKRRHAAASAG